MDKANFLLQDRVKQIETSFIQDGWLTIYEISGEKVEDQYLIFCCIVDSIRMRTYVQDRNWVISPGSEGKPAIIGTYEKGKWKDTYHTFSEKGIEPFIYSRRFSHNGEHYIDISEEFALYFKLYENGNTKQNRKYYFVDDLGELEEVIVIEPKKVKIKLRFLMEYISIRKVNFAICFDFTRLEKGSLHEHNIEPSDKDFKGDKYFYNHFIRHLDFDLQGNTLQSWIHGKVFIYYDKKKSNNYHFEYENHPYEKFMTGYDENGDEVFENCKKENGKLFKLTYFKKEVLDKYYNEPTKYEVDGWHVKSRFFILKIDNHNENYVAVFLTELGSIPYKEQLHWKHHNISPQGGMSHAYYKTMIEGNWAEHSETADLFFKEKFRVFNEKWKGEFGWYFYKPLSKEDKHFFTSLHIPTGNNIKAFCEQILSLVKITIDSLNENELAKGLELENNDRGITKLEKFLEEKGISMPDMIEFLRNLQNLRSGLIAHRFSNSNKKVKEALEYFNIKEDNLKEIAYNIFIKSIFTLNTLERLLLT